MKRYHFAGAPINSARSTWVFHSSRLFFEKLRDRRRACFYWSCRLVKMQVVKDLMLRRFGLFWARHFVVDSEIRINSYEANKKQWNQGQ